MLTVWKIAPGDHAEDWPLFRDHGCIGLGWTVLTDYERFDSWRSVLRALEQKVGHGVEGSGPGAAKMIYLFAHVIKPGDVVVANEGYNTVVGIGWVEGRYLPAKSRKTPIWDDKTTHRHHVRLVNWLIKQRVDLPGSRFFSRPTLYRLKPRKVEQIKQAFLKAYPYDSELRSHLEDLFDVPGQNALVQDLNAINHQPHVDHTTKKALVDARLGQGKFRSDVLRFWGNCCSVTGSTVQAAIRASHIKPWRESGNAERLDSNNGLALVASLDALFDAGLISFDSAGRLLASRKLSATDRDIFGLGETSLRMRPNARMAEYLAHHRERHGF